MENPGLPELLWQELDGRLWHATSPAGLSGILGEGAIRLAGGVYSGSMASRIPAVSVFDFGPTANANPAWGQFSHWSGWFGYQQKSRVAVWLEIDREAVATDLWDAGRAHAWWKEKLVGSFLPGVEAFHCGPIPVAAISGCLIIAQQDLDRFQRLLPNTPWVDAVAQFEAELPPVVESPGDRIAAILEEARLRHRGSRLQRNDD